MKNLLMLAALLPCLASAEETSPSLDAARAVLEGGAGRVYDGARLREASAVSGGLAASVGSFGFATRLGKASGLGLRARGLMPRTVSRGRAARRGRGAYYVLSAIVGAIACAGMGMLILGIIGVVLGVPQLAIVGAAVGAVIGAKIGATKGWLPNPPSQGSGM